MDLAIDYNLTEWKIERFKHLIGRQGGLVPKNEF